MPRTLPATFEGKPDEDAQERLMNALCREEVARSVLAGEMRRPEAAASFGVTAKTASKWAGRFQDLGLAGHADHSSMPRRLRGPAPGHAAERIVSLRRSRHRQSRHRAATARRRPFGARPPPVRSRRRTMRGRAETVVGTGVRCLGRNDRPPSGRRLGGDGCRRHRCPRRRHRPARLGRCRRWRRDAQTKACRKPGSASPRPRAARMPPLCHDGVVAMAILGFGNGHRTGPSCSAHGGAWPPACPELA